MTLIPEPLQQVSATGFEWRLPAGVPPPPVPVDNPMSDAKVALGRALFFDVRLSRTGDHACASCHAPERAFTDGRLRALGATGEAHRFGAPSIAYAAYAPSLGWLASGPRHLEAQVEQPLLGARPVELGMGDRVPLLLATLRADAYYERAFHEAFPDEVNPFRIEIIARAIAAWERTLTPFDSPYDRWVFEDDREALSARARAGAALFASDRLGCAECHRGLLFGAADPWSARDEVVAESAHRGSIGASGSVVAAMRFRVPSLRNVALTAPYMHDGRFATLGEVLDYYARGGGRGAIDGDREDAGGLAASARGFELSAEERQSLLAFLESLSDEVYVGGGEARRLSGARSGGLAD